jgi:hypothetical protein
VNGKHARENGALPLFNSPGSFRTSGANLGALAVLVYALGRVELDLVLEAFCSRDTRGFAFESYTMASGATPAHKKSLLIRRNGALP